MADPISESKSLNLPRMKGDQYYLVEVHDGGKPAFAATRERNSYEIISNVLRIHSMDWGEIIHRARRMGKPFPTLELTDAPGRENTNDRFEFECGTFLVLRCVPKGIARRSRCTFRGTGLAVPASPFPANSG